MEDKADFLSSKLQDFAVEIVKLCKKQQEGWVEKHIYLQLLRSATSIGANYEEGRCAESRNDFIHKLHISLKECRESLFWLNIAHKSGINDLSETDPLIKKGEEISRILAKSIKTAKENRIRT